jgi:hypothetical protein
MKLFQFWQWIKNCADADSKYFGHCPSRSSTDVWEITENLGGRQMVAGFVVTLRGHLRGAPTGDVCGFWVIDVDQNY